MHLFYQCEQDFLLYVTPPENMLDIYISMYYVFMEGYLDMICWERIDNPRPNVFLWE